MIWPSPEAHVDTGDRTRRHEPMISTFKPEGCYYLAYVVSHEGDFQLGIELTDRSRTLYNELDQPWEQVANGLFAARAAISAGDHDRAVASPR